MSAVSAHDQVVVIDTDLVEALLAAHLPHAASLTISSLAGGWDNRSFRAGENYVVRLSSADRYAASAEKEPRVLTLLADRLPLPIPRVVTSFGPGQLFAWPWSVLDWIDGDTAESATGETWIRLARDLGAFLRALHALDPADGPAPGAHSFGRGGPLKGYDAEVRWALPRLGDRAAVATAVWERALAAPFAGTPVWVHGDPHPGNLLVREGRLAAVIDWGLAAVGDPAADLSIAWRWFDGEARRVFREAVPADEEAWARGAGWAAWRAAIILAGLPGIDARERRGCWIHLPAKAGTLFF